MVSTQPHGRAIEQAQTWTSKPRGCCLWSQPSAPDREESNCWLEVLLQDSLVNSRISASANHRDLTREDYFFTWACEAVVPLINEVGWKVHFALLRLSLSNIKSCVMIRSIDVCIIIYVCLLFEEKVVPRQYPPSHHIIKALVARGSIHGLCWSRHWTTMAW